MRYLTRDWRCTGQSLVCVSTLVLTLTALETGCKKNEPAPNSTPTTVPGPPSAEPKRVQVTKVELGNALGDDKRVKSPATSFSKKDTIFASVVTEGGSAPSELSAKWTFHDGQLVNETKRSIAPSALAVTEFSIQKADGWPSGEYKVEISLDGKPVDTKTFSVQ